MKRKLHTLLFLVGMSVIVHASNGVTVDQRHFLYVEGSLGYSTLFNNSGVVKPGPGIAPAVGFGYRYNRNGFILGTGVEARYGYLTNKVPNQNLQIAMLDTEGEQFTMLADVTDCKDACHAIDVQVPIQFGYEYRRFYAMAGVKLGVNVVGSTISQSSVTTSAQYDRFIDPFADMPNHELKVGDLVKSDKYNCPFGFNLMGHLEVGARVGEVTFESGADVEVLNYRMYVSAFADYGFLNIHKDVSKGEVLSYKETDEGVKFYIVPSMVSSQMYKKTVNPLTVGVKFTVLFELAKPKKCVICMF